MRDLVELLLLTECISRMLTSFFKMMQYLDLNHAQMAALLFNCWTQTELICHQVFPFIPLIGFKTLTYLQCKARNGLPIRLAKHQMLSFIVGVLQAEFLSYLQSYTDRPAGTQADPEGKLRQPFLKRTLSGVAMNEDEEMLALESADLCNGLECKFSTSTSKVYLLLQAELLLAFFETMQW